MTTWQQSVIALLRRDITIPFRGSNPARIPVVPTIRVPHIQVSPRASRIWRPNRSLWRLEARAILQPVLKRDSSQESPTCLSRCAHSADAPTTAEAYKLTNTLRSRAKHAKRPHGSPPRKNLSPLSRHINLVVSDMCMALGSSPGPPYGGRPAFLSIRFRLLRTFSHIAPAPRHAFLVIPTPSDSGRSERALHPRQRALGQQVAHRSRPAVG